MTGTRDAGTMVAWARNVSAGELRAVRSEAAREFDRDLVAIIDAELKRRGLA